MPNPSAAGANVTFTAVVAETLQAAEAEAIAKPTGQVTFKQQDGTVLGAGTLSDGAATFQTAALPNGVNVLVAQYEGDATYAVSTSPEVRQQVDAPPTAVNDAAGTLQGTPVQIAVLTNDADPAGGGLTKDLFYLIFTPIITPTARANQPPQGMVFAGFQFRLEAYLNNQRLDNFVFGQPVKVTFAYSLAALGDVREETLMPHYWNDSAWSTDGITVLNRDLVNHMLTMQLTHLSEFGLFAEPTSGQPPPY